MEGIAEVKGDMNKVKEAKGNIRIKGRKKDKSGSMNESCLERAKK